MGARLPNPLPLSRSSGFTLVELLVTLAVLAVLLAAVTPLTQDWIYASHTREGRGKLIQAYGTAKALALRNAAQADSASAAAGLKVVVASNVATVLVCGGSPTATACANGGAAVVWQASLPANVTVAIGGTAATASAARTIALSNRAIPTSSTSFTISRGSTNNDETGTLY